MLVSIELTFKKDTIMATRQITWCHHDGAQGCNTLNVIEAGESRDVDECGHVTQAQFHSSGIFYQVVFWDYKNSYEKESTPPDSKHFLWRNIFPSLSLHTALI